MKHLKSVLLKSKLQVNRVDIGTTMIFLNVIYRPNKVTLNSGSTIGAYSFGASVI